MKITELRTKEILNWLDDKAADHTLLFEEMTLFRDAASLVRQLQADEQEAWHAGLDAGREQVRGNEHCQAEPQPAGVVQMYSGLLYARLDGDFPVGTKLYAHQPPSAPVGVDGKEVLQRHMVTKYRDGSIHVADLAAQQGGRENG